MMTSCWYRQQFLRFKVQILLNACEEELLAIDMYVNKKKSMCIRFGWRYTERCAELVTADGGHLSWVDRCRYLGVHFTRGCSLRCCFEEAKSCFSRAFNAIFSKTGCCASEPVILNLLRSKCVPILLYAVDSFIHSFTFNSSWDTPAIGPTNSVNIIYINPHFY